MQLSNIRELECVLDFLYDVNQLRIDFVIHYLQDHSAIK